jgi:hypothetical protein
MAALKRAYQILFVKLNGIQQSLKDILDKTDVDVRASLVQKSWSMRPDMMLYGVMSAAELKVLPELQQLYTTVWKLSQDDFDLVKYMFTPDSLIRYDSSDGTQIPLSFGDEPISWEKALAPGFEERKKGVQVPYGQTSIGLDLYFKPRSQREKGSLKQLLRKGTTGRRQT